MSRPDRNRLFFLSILWVGVIAASFASAQEKENAEKQAEDLLEKIRADADGNIDAGDISDRLKQLGEKALPVLTRHAKDENLRIRRHVAFALSEIRDEKVIPVLMQILADPDEEVKRSALDGLSAHPAENLAKHGGALQPLLAKAAGAWDAQSAKAVLLIGKLGDRAGASALKKLRGEINKIRGSEDPRAKLVPEMKKACLMSLLYLGDKEAEREVDDNLASDSVSSRTLGIECVAFTESEDLLEKLLPLLDDKRDAVPAGPPGDRIFLRVRDLAANAIVEVSKTPASSFRSTQGSGGYTDDEIQALKVIIGEKKEPKRTVRPDAAPKPIAPPKEAPPATIPEEEDKKPSPDRPAFNLPAQPAPPLGLSDSAKLLTDALTLLDYFPTSATLAPRRGQVVYRVEQVEKYLDHIAVIMSGDIPYTWHELYKKWVYPGENMTATFAPEKPVENVMALRFDARRWGDVYLNSVDVLDADDVTHTYIPGGPATDGQSPGGPILISSDLPRREILYLDRPLTVKAVIPSMSHNGERKRRVYVDLGVPHSPEYAREISRLCRKALSQLDAGDLSAAQATLLRARDRVRDFRVNLGEMAKEK